KLVRKTRRLKAGDPRKRDTFLGPMITEEAAKRLEGWVDEAEAAGAKVLVGGKRKGNMLDATLLESVPYGATVSRQEAFGPVALLEPFADFSDALGRVNDSEYGLQAGIFTNDLTHTME